jgi:hypothetical protein
VPSDLDADFCSFLMPSHTSETGHVLARRDTNSPPVLAEGNFPIATACLKPTEIGVTAMAAEGSFERPLTQSARAVHKERGKRPQEQAQESGGEQARPDPPPGPPEAVQVWCTAWRHRFSKYALRGHKDRLPVVRWAVRNQHLYREHSLNYFAEQIRTFMNVHLRLDNTTPGKLLGPSGTWVKKHRALRNKEEQETGTSVPDTDYLEAMDQWLAVLDDHEALKANNKDQVEALRQTQKAKTQALQAEMATRMRGRVRLTEGEEEALRDAGDTIPPEEDTVYEDWSESELGDVPGRQSSGQPGRQPGRQSTEQPLLPIRPLASGSPSVSSSSLKRSLISVTPAREEKRFKIETRLDTMRKISQHYCSSRICLRTTHDCITAPQQAAALGAGAACMGAALAVNVAVQGLVHALAVALEEDDEPEDRTEAAWTTNRLSRLRLRSRQLRQQNRRNRREA